jgi:hypothetical protein
MSNACMDTEDDSLERRSRSDAELFHLLSHFESGPEALVLREKLRIKGCLTEED